jgi:NAD(P)-dependent dehydrogenase (short-subunit alcohol dehydrogenase family)
VRLAGRVALVIGGGGGIGRAICVRFASEGARIAVADVAADAGRQTQRLVGQSGAEVEFFPVDVTRRESAHALIEQVEAHFGRLDVLVNSAGIGARMRIEDASDDLWDRVVAVNLTGVYWPTRYAIPALRRAGGGVILSLASIAGIQGWPGSAIYSATKGGVVNLMRSIAGDYAKENIRAWAICPPAVDTPLLHYIYKSAPDPAEARRAYEATLPAGRMVTPEEVAALAAYLAGDEGFPYTPLPFVL